MSSKQEPLPPQPQSFYDTERQRFNAESYGLDLKSLKDGKCSHTNVKRLSFNEVKCQCGMGWYDQNRFVIENGRITGIR